MDAAAAPARITRLAPGTRLGRYFLLRTLALGGMAQLHLACAEGAAGFRKVVVVKHVLPHLAADPDFVRLFLNEARLAASLDHPNIVQVTDVGEADGEYFYVMEYVHGRNARELLGEASRAGGLPLEAALTIAIGAASALHHAHEAADVHGRPLGLIHRDVSPSNLLVSYEGAVKLTDFGIAKALAHKTETIGGTLKGKVGYMSPEQCRGQGLDRRSDVFSLGVVLFELTTCERLFFADNDFAVLHQVMSGRYDVPSDRRPDYPPELEAIVRRALAVDADQRYATADELRADLERFVHERRLRCTPAALGAWMTESCGRTEYPRIELVSSDDVAAPAFPSLVMSPDPAVAPAPTPGPAVVGRRSRPWLWGAMAASVLGVGIMWAGLGRPGSLEGGDPANAEGGAEAATSVDRPRSTAGGVPANAEGGADAETSVDRPRSLDAPEPIHAPLPKTAGSSTSSDAVVSTGADEGGGASSTGAIERERSRPVSGRRRSRRSTRTKKSPRPSPELDSLYPVGR